MYELTPNAGLEGKPPGFLPALMPQWGQLTPWAMTSAAQFLPPAPPPVGSAEYAADFNQVKIRGDSNRYALPRSPQAQDDYDLAHFWADVPGHSVTPPGHWDEIAEHMALQEHFNLEENAHLFALVNIGLADAAINCWDAKYIYNYWRPITAIRDPRASQINPANTSDPNWTPLWNTPNFPSYTSGHSTFSGTASTILASIFGPDTHFTDGSDDMPGYGRSFVSFAQAADEAGESRVVGGIHFQFDNTAGLAAGRALGGYISQNFLMPLEDNGGDSGGGSPGDAFRKGSNGLPGSESSLLFYEFSASRGSGAVAGESASPTMILSMARSSGGKQTALPLTIQTDLKRMTPAEIVKVGRLATKVEASDHLFAQFSRDQGAHSAGVM